MDKAAASEQPLLRGGGCIIAPDGSYVVEPVFDDEEIITAELDFEMIDKEKMTLDVSGHYFRPDVFNLEVNRGTRRIGKARNLVPALKV